MRVFFLIVIICFSIQTYSQVETMSLAEIKKGMKGKGYTVFEGSTIEDFNFEIKSIIPGENSIKNFILADFYGDLIAKSGGLSEGMSGSPLFIADKLIGFLSYRLETENKILGVILPVDEVKRKFPEVFEGVYNNKILPGASVSLSPIVGDIYMDNIATLGLATDKHFYLLGHSFNNKGDVSYYLNKSYVDQSINGMPGPYKIAHSTDTIGVVLKDTHHGLFGKMSEEIDSIEFEMQINDNQVSFEMVKDLKTANMYLQKSLEIATMKYFDEDNFYSGSFEFTILNNENEIFTKRNFYFFESAFVENFTNVLSEEILTILDNPIKNIEFNKIKIDMELSSDKKVSYIRNMDTLKDVFQPGEDVVLYLDYLLYKKGLRRRRLEVSLPPETKVGSYIVTLKNTFDQYKQPDSFNSLQAFINYYKSVQGNNEIILHIRNENSGLIIEKRYEFDSLFVYKGELEKKIIVDSFEANLEEYNGSN